MGEIVIVDWTFFHSFAMHKLVSGYGSRSAGRLSVSICLPPSPLSLPAEIFVCRAFKKALLQAVSGTASEAVGKRKEGKKAEGKTRDSMKRGKDCFALLFIFSPLLSVCLKPESRKRREKLKSRTHRPSRATININRD